MNTEPDIPDPIRRQARDWLTVMHSGQADAATDRAFRAWINDSPEHARAYARLESLHRSLGDVAVEAGVDVDALLRPGALARARAWLAERVRRPALATGAAVAAAVAVALVVAPWDAGPPAHPSYATAVAELREIALEDGSVVTLGAKSRIETVFTDAGRQVTLVSGEAFFDVAPDQARPFFVTAHDTLIRVVGTRFEVKRVTGRVHVSVLEGVVEVMKTPPADRPSRTAAPAVDRQVLTAGQKLVAVAAAPLADVEHSRLDVAGGWRTGRLAYDDASLEEIIADVNRYADRQIRLGSPDLADIRLTTAFRTSEIDDMLDILEASQPIRVDRTGRGPIVLRPRD